MRFNIATFIAYEALWFAVVIGAHDGRPWLCVLLATIFVAWQIGMAENRRDALRLAVVAIVLGVAVDGGAAGLGFVRYASAELALPPGGAPLWILSLWAAFGVTLAGPFRWIRGKPTAAMLLGAVGGPMSYLGAARGWDTVGFVAPGWHGVVYLAVGWGVAMAVLATTPRLVSTGAAPIERRRDERVQ